MEAFAYRAQSRDELARCADEEIELGLGLVTFMAYGGLAAGGAFSMGHGGLDFLGHLCQSQLPELVLVTLHRCGFVDTDFAHR